MVGDMNLEPEARRFFENAMQDLDIRGKNQYEKLRQETPRFFEGARQGLHVLGPVVAELDRHLARRFSPFSYIHLDENCMSKVLADLLRPESEHGQGDLFLAAFVKHLRNHEATKRGMQQIFPNEPTWSSVRVFREALTTHIEAWNRRIDIEISIMVERERVGIAIENKPSAEDQQAQLKDYADHLDRKYKGNYMLLYLTPDGNPPECRSLTNDQRTKLGDHFACASLVEWAQGWIREAENLVKAGYVQRFVADFRQVLLERYADSDTEPYSSMLAKP